MDSPSKMSWPLSPTTSSTVPSSSPFAPATFQPRSISNQETGSLKRDLPPTYQTGPCVDTGFVSERARRISSEPVRPRSSRRSMQRRTISGDAP